MRVDPDGAAVGVSEAGQHALTGHARAGDDDREAVCFQRFSNARRNALVHSGRRTGSVPKGSSSLNGLHEDRVSLVLEDPGETCVEQTPRTGAGGMPIVAGAIGDLDHGDIHPGASRVGRDGW